LASERELVAHKYDGFWAAMDTFKDKQLLDDMYARGNAPWEVWKQGANGESRPTRKPRRSTSHVGTNAHARMAHHGRNST